MSEYLRQKNVSITFVDAPSHVNLDLMEKAANFYAATLMPHLRRKIHVTIRWTYSRKMKHRAEVEFECGSQVRDFTINMHGRHQGWEVYQSLAHEFVHVKQWATDELIEIDDKLVEWQGKLYSWDDGDTMKYWDLPWEFQAMGMEYGLYAKFKMHYGLKGRDLRAVKH